MENLSDNVYIIAISILFIVLVVCAVILNYKIKNVLSFRAKTSMRSKILLYKNLSSKKFNYCAAVQFDILSKQIGQSKPTVFEIFVREKISDFVVEVSKKYKLLCYQIEAYNFVILNPNLRDTSDVRETLEALFNEFCQFKEDSCSIYLGAVISSPLSNNPTEVLDTVLSTKRIANQQGKSNFRILDLDNQTELASQFGVGMKSDMSNIIPHYQPIYDTKTDLIIGSEVFTRWNHNNELEYPETFIPIAIKRNLLQVLDMMMFDKAVNMTTEFKPKGIKSHFVVLRISQDSTSSQLQSRYLSTLKGYKANLNNFVFEVKYSELKDKQFINLVQSLQKAKFNLALDVDAVADIEVIERLLSTLHFKYAKIDFVQYIASNLNDVIDYFNANKVKVLAFKVENKETVENLSIDKVAYAQGYAYSKPIDKESLFTSILGGGK